MTKAVVKKKKKINIERLTELIRSIKSIEQTKKELEAQAEEAKNEIKEVMLSNGLEEMDIDVFTVRYKPVVTSRFNSTELKKVNPELYAKYVVESESMKFTIT
ncbi:MAG: hypothetical protein J6C96_03995 [Oscillospiraceae bacterium]|nr:hypothetical protein [Oscillospiraceae bacterium]